MSNKLSSVHQTVQQQRQTILDIAATHGATTVKIFGSAGRDEASPESDLDLLVEFETAYSLLHMIALKQDLEDLLGCPVDVVTEAALSPYIREQVLAEAIRL